MNGVTHVGAAMVITLCVYKLLADSLQTEHPSLGKELVVGTASYVSGDKGMFCVYLSIFHSLHRVPDENWRWYSSRGSVWKMDLR